MAPVADSASLPDLVVTCSVDTLIAPTATDNCLGTITGLHNATLPITTNSMITWSFTDGGGNTSTQTQNVIITDAIAPVPNVASLPDWEGSCAINWVYSVSATDNCGGSIYGTLDVSLPVTTQGITVATWTYDDGNGNITTQTQNFIVDDTYSPDPDVNLLPDIVAACSVNSLVAPTADDYCEGTIIGVPNVTLPITSSTTIIWSYDDGNGNIETQPQSVVITDGIPPVVDLVSLSDVTSECSVSSLIPPSATDNCAGAIIGTTNTSFPISAQGTTTITWSFNDGNGNVSTQMQDVIITDVSLPVADNGTLSDVISACVVDSVAAPTATDNCSGTLIGTPDLTFPITSSTTITWSYDDGHGNIATQTQYVSITGDVTAPLADSVSLSDLTVECSITSLTAPTASDNCAGSIIGTHTISLPITTQGITTITWTYDDGNGNTSTQLQDVVIADVLAPVENQANLSDVTSECSIPSLNAPTATDNCSGGITGTTDVSFPITTIGTTTVTWTYDDGNGNTSTQTQDVIITPIDNGITQVDAITLSADAAGYNYQWIDCDNTNAPIASATSQTFTPSIAGNYACEIDNGTCMVTTACLTSSLGIVENSFGNALVVYPNPTFGQLKIDLGSVHNGTTVKVYNSLGQIITNESFGTTSEINLNIDGTSGMYVLEINTEEGKTAKVNVIKE